MELAGALTLRLQSTRASAAPEPPDEVLLSDAALVRSPGLPRLLVRWLTAARETGWRAEEREEQETASREHGPASRSAAAGCCSSGLPPVVLKGEERFDRGLLRLGRGGGVEGVATEGGGVREVGGRLTLNGSTILRVFLCMFLVCRGGARKKDEMSQRTESSLTLLALVICRSDTPRDPVAAATDSESPRL